MALIYKQQFHYLTPLTDKKEQFSLLGYNQYPNDAGIKREPKRLVFLSFSLLKEAKLFLVLKTLGMWGRESSFHVVMELNEGKFHALFLGWFFIIVSILAFVIVLFILSISSSFRFVRLYFSKNLTLSSRLLILSHVFAYSSFLWCFIFLHCLLWLLTFHF